MVEINPKDDNAYSELGTISYLLNDYEKSRRSFAKAFEINPNNAQTYNDFASVLIEENNDLKAMEFVLKTSQLNPLNPLYNLTYGQIL